VEVKVYKDEAEFMASGKWNPRIPINIQARIAPPPPKWYQREWVQDFFAMGALALFMTGIYNLIVAVVT